MNSRPVSFQILGVRVDPLSQRELNAEIMRLLESDQKQLLLNVNIHCLNLAYKNAWLRHFLNSAHLVYCDSFGVILGAALLGHHIPERTTFADWIYPLSDLAAQHGYTLFFLGARSGVAEEAACRLQKTFPGLRVVGTHHGYFDKSPDSSENQSVIDTINAARPDILVVCFGMPLQEQWLMNNWEKLDARIGLTAGAMLDYVAGVVRRPPHWMTDHGLEWLGRLLIEPRRLWKRYLIGIPVFVWRVLMQKCGLLRIEDQA
jgi:N-acetylglucosaminyldiphosphoundecaprenol N-acetyl-beta-D-mannosaminyltransferase